MATALKMIKSVKPDELLYLSLSEEIRNLEKIKKGLAEQIKSYAAGGGELKTLVVATKSTSRISSDLLAQAGLNPDDFKVVTEYQTILKK